MRKSRAVLIFAFLAAPLWAKEQAVQPTKKLTLQDLLRSTVKKSSQPVTTAGVRGLDETTAGVDTKARDYNAVEKLDHLVIHDDELAKFIQEGKLK